MLRSFKTSAVICLLLVLVVSIAPVVYAANWRVLVPAENISKIFYEGNIRNVTYDFGVDPYVSWKCTGSNGSFYSSTDLELDHTVSPPFYFTVYPLGVGSVGGPPLGSAASGQLAIDVSDFKSDAIFDFHANFHVDFDIGYDSIPDSYTSEPYTLSVSWLIQRYTSTGTYLGTQDSSAKTFYPVLQDTDDRYVYEIDIDQYCTLSPPSDNVEYIIPMVSVSLIRNEYTGNIDLRSLHFAFEDFTISTRTDMLLKESLTLEAIENELSETNDKLDDTNDKLDEIILQPDEEKQQALDEGGGLAGELTDALPDKSQGFMSGIQKLANSMSYEGTDAKLTIPAIEIPAIPGLFGKCRILDEQEVDFSFFVQKMPEPVITLVQVVLTIGLIVYAFKEFYAMISYAMTLKSGGGD